MAMVQSCTRGGSY